ncbi:hypothetical protein LCGC14_1099700 [marine sediment metagenome]|uniref:Uncharacterized protein n=1 Tax=marine sediment metagenome TaxID=412755 RepID=A0A0F9QFZ7_9ZZZZ
MKRAESRRRKRGKYKCPGLQFLMEIRVGFILFLRLTLLRFLLHSKYKNVQGSPILGRSNGALLAGIG